MKVNLSVYQLRNMHLAKHPHSHYFDDDTLKFFGERLSDMSVLKNTAEVTDSLGKKHNCYVLSKTSKIYVDKRQRTYAYFDVDTLEDIA